MTSKFNRVTRVADDRVEVIESFGGRVSDTIILAREAADRQSW